jgi:hypothetical protein
MQPVEGQTGAEIGSWCFPTNRREHNTLSHRQTPRTRNGVTMRRSDVKRELIRTAARVHIGSGTTSGWLHTPAG